MKKEVIVMCVLATLLFSSLAVGLGSYHPSTNKKTNRYISQDIIRENSNTKSFLNNIKRTNFENASEIGEGEYKGNLKPHQDLYFKINIPAHKKLHISFHANLTLYNCRGKVQYYQALQEGYYHLIYGENSSTNYLVYIKITNPTNTTSNYDLCIEFISPKKIDGNKTVKGAFTGLAYTTKVPVDWYVINIPNGSYLNLSYETTSSGEGWVDIDAYDYKGDSLDGTLGEKSGYVEIYPPQENGTIYIEVGPDGWSSSGYVAYSITPHIVSESQPTEAEPPNYQGICLAGVIIMILLVIVIAFVIIKTKKKSNIQQSQEKEMITVTCPYCGYTSQVPENMRGQWVKCPNCGNQFQVP